MVKRLNNLHSMLAKHRWPLQVRNLALKKITLSVFYVYGCYEQPVFVDEVSNPSSFTLSQPISFYPLHPPSQHIDEVSNQFRHLAEVLGCSHDDFIRTTENRHKEAVAKLWAKLEANGQIYLGAYEGWYSIRDEAFYQESELVNGKAPTGSPLHPSSPSARGTPALPLSSYEI